MKHSYPAGRWPLARYLTTWRPGATLAALLLTLGGAVAPAFGQGTFSAPTLYGTNGDSPIGVAVGDLNGDARPDIVVNNYQSSGQNVIVRLNSATTVGTFPTSTLYSSGADATVGSAIGDVNGDGRADIVVSSFGNNSVGVLLNAGTGTFPATATTYSTGGSSPTGIALGDVNGDGRLDIVVAHQGGNVVGVLLNSATTPGTFGTAATYTVSRQGYSPRLGDVNGDGRLDIVVGGLQNNQVSVLLNSATTPGTFGTATSYSTGGEGPLGMELSDVDSDGRLDIIVNHIPPSTVVSVLRNSSTTPGTFRPAVTYNNGGGGEGLAVGDVNSDGKPDLIVTRNNDGKVGVLLNSGTGTFPTVTSYVVSSDPNNTVITRVALGDVNADNLLDIVATDFRGNNVGVLRNTSAAVAPTLSSVSPGSGLVGSSVTLTGTNLFGTTSVRFNGTLAGTFTVVNGTTITATVPTGATSGNVTVVNAGGTSNGVGFTVITNTPTLTAPANGAVTNTRPEYRGTAVPGSNVFIFRAAGSGGAALTDTTYANALGNFHKFSGAALASGQYSAYVSAAASGQGNSANSNTNTFTVDATAPTVTLVSSTVASGSTTTTSPVNFTATFSEPVTGFTSAGILVGNGSVTSGPTAGSGNTYTFQVSPSGAGSVSVQVIAGAARDQAGNNNASSATYAFTFQAPTIAVSPGSLPGGTQGTAYSVTFTASGGSGTYTFAVTVGSPPPGMSLSGSTLSGTPTASGSFSFRITARDNSPTPGPYSGFRDYTLNIAAQPVTPAPVVTTPANGAIIAANTPTYTGTASASASVTVLVDNASVGTTTANSAGNWSLTQPSALSQGNHTVRATAQLSGQAVSSSSGTNSFTVDTTAPTATISSSAGSNGGTTTTSPLPFTVTFSESVTGFAAGDVTVSNGTVSGFSGSGTTYTFNVTPTTAGTATTVNIAANAAQDAAGNGNTAASPFSLTYNFADLTISSGSATSPVDVPAGTYNTVTVTGTGFARLAGAVVVNTTFTVQAGGALNTNCQGLTGSGAFTLQDGATLYVCNAAGITSSGSTGAVQVSGTRSFSPNADYVYNGTAAQSTGNGLPSQVRNLTSTNSNTLTLSQALAIRQVLALNNGGFELNGQALTLLSDASGTALVANLGGDNGVITGTTVTVQRYIDPTLNPGLGYRHLAAPVFGATVGDFRTGSTQPVVNDAYNSATNPGTVTPFPTIFRYDQSRLASSPATTLSTFDKGWVSPASLGDNADLAFTGFTVQLPGASTLSFTGAVIGRQGVIPLSRATDATAADAGLNLIGNPYPSPLDLSTIGASQRSNVDAAFYVFESTSQYGGNYRSYVNGVGSNALLGTAQAFFVRVTNGQSTGSLALNNGNRVATYNRQAPVRRTAAEARPLVQLSLKAAGRSTGDDAFVYFEQGSTEGFDTQYDALKLPNSSGLNLSTTVAGRQLSIDGRSAIGTGQRAIPLAVGVPAAGSYSLSSAQLLNLDTTPVYLRDLQTGAMIDLKQQPSYSFTVTNASALITNRFELVFSPQQALATAAVALAQQVALYPNPAKQTASVELPASLGRQPVQASLFDAVGRQVYTTTLPAQGATVHALDVRALPPGVYQLRLQTSAGLLVKRLSVE